MKRIWMRALALAVGAAVLLGGALLAGCGKEGETENVDLRAIIDGERLVAETPVDLDNSPVYAFSPTEVEASEDVLPARATGKTEQTYTVTRDENFGGGQFIEKLFTEALSRAAGGAEFAAFQQYVVEHGCNVQSLKVLARAVFTSEAYASFAFNRVEQAFSLYRALLSRDPTAEEILAVTLNNLSEKIDEILDGEEFAQLLADVRFGPIGWRGNNQAMWTGELVTMREFQKRFDTAKDGVVELPQGALVLVDTGFTLPVGATVRTEGNPDHYLRFARFLRVNPSVPTLTMVSETAIQNLFLDGNCAAFDQATFNLPITGRDNVVWGCRMSDSVAPIHTNPGAANTYCARNLVTQYGTIHTGKANGWADGIDMYSHHAIVEYNHVVDATDAGIVLFRAREGERDVPQNSVVRYNLICNTGNSGYCGIDNEGVDMVGTEVADFAGTVIYGNAIYTSYVAHLHMCVTLSARPWTEQYKKVKNDCLYNNYSPAGCFVNTAGGIVVEGVDNGTVRGNQFEFRLGDWSTNFLGKRAYSVNSSSCTGGDYQEGWLDWSATGFISPVMDIEKDVSVNLEVAYVHEAFQKIPAAKFVWSAQRPAS